MNPSPGEIVFVLAPIAGYRKYHLCLGQNDSGTHLFLYLNSDNGFAGDAVFECARFPTIPPSVTGESVVSFSMMPRFTAAQLQLHGATSLGVITREIAAELVVHCATAKTLPRSEKAFALQALSVLAT